MLSGDSFQTILTHCYQRVHSNFFQLNVIRKFSPKNSYLMLSESVHFKGFLNSVTESSLRTTVTQFHQNICSKQFFPNVIRGFIPNNSYLMARKVQFNQFLHNFIRYFIPNSPYSMLSECSAPGDLTQFYQKFT